MLCLQLSCWRRSQERLDAAYTELSMLQALKHTRDNEARGTTAGEPLSTTSSSDRDSGKGTAPTTTLSRQDSYSQMTELEQVWVKIADLRQDLGIG